MHRLFCDERFSFLIFRFVYCFRHRRRRCCCWLWTLEQVHERFFSFHFRNLSDLFCLVSSAGWQKGDCRWRERQFVHSRRMTNSPVKSKVITKIAPVRRLWRAMSWQHVCSLANENVCDVNIHLKWWNHGILSSH